MKAEIALTQALDAEVFEDGSEELTVLMHGETSPFARDGEPPEIGEIRASLEKSGRLPQWVLERAPYLVGAKEYADLLGTKAQDAQRARTALYLSLLTNIVQTAGLMALTWLLVSAPRALPYIVSLDKTGYAMAVKPAEQTAGADERVIIASIARWIRSLRTVVGDKEAQRTLVESVYAMLAANSEASRKTRSWLQEHSPYDAVDRRVEVEIVRIAPMGSDKVYSVDWIERERTASSSVNKEARYSALVTIKLSPLQRLDELIANPLGVFVVEYTISKIQ